MSRVNNIIEGLRDLDTFEYDICEMASVDKNEAKLPYDVWLDTAGSSRNVQHDTPRLKIKVDNDLIPVEISSEPKLLVDYLKKITKFRKIKEWIVYYKDVLIKHWNGEINDRQVLNIVSNPIGKE